jgi:hypothetical protein
VSFSHTVYSLRLERVGQARQQSLLLFRLNQILQNGAQAIVFFMFDGRQLDGWGRSRRQPAMRRRLGRLAPDCRVVADADHFSQAMNLPTPDFCG